MIKYNFFNFFTNTKKLKNKVLGISLLLSIIICQNHNEKNNSVSVYPNLRHQ